jgi:hypothetical protein
MIRLSIASHWRVFALWHSTFPEWDNVPPDESCLFEYERSDWGWVARSLQRDRPMKKRRLSYPMPIKERRII